jgi:hypothetical protein
MLYLRGFGNVKSVFDVKAEVARRALRGATPICLVERDRFLRTAHDRR